ncbi:MAG: eukaryotic-like serine/threonine-protein kinase, partial [Kribbellaceae bacterium]|nr:eukaryotic-like serine/threonine-protein kinase [Kribbellaceae bacterium]
FNRRTLPELAYAVAILPPPMPSLYGVPAAFDEVVRRAMAKEPERRYPTAAEFGEALQAAAAGSAVPAVHRVRRRRVAVWAAIAVPVVVVGGVAATVLAQGHETPATKLTVCAEDATVRDAPRSKTVIAKVYRGDQLTPIAERDGDSWVHVQLPDGRNGWALTDFVRHQC